MGPGQLLGRHENALLRVKILDSQQGAFAGFNGLALHALLARRDLADACRH